MVLYRCSKMEELGNFRKKNKRSHKSDSFAASSLMVSVDSSNVGVPEPGCAGSTPSYSLESKLCDCKRAAAIRREARCTDRVKEEEWEEGDGEEDGGSL
ncbi:hypothetical protein V6N12_007880, partial [Hibiscus sabdariffa]